MLDIIHQRQQRWVPVVSFTGKPLMPCHPARARKLVSRGKATTRFLKGLFYIQLTERADGDTQPTALGIDPGSKREGYTVKATKRTFLNIHAHAVDGKGIQKTLEGRSNARRSSRQRNTPYRANRKNRGRSKGWVPPSTRARWQLKLNVTLWLTRLYPLTTVVVEDVSAELKKGDKRRNSGFSPVQNGKNWFYRQLTATGLSLVTKRGMETYQLRQQLGLHKTKQKLAMLFSAHCVDSWALAFMAVGGDTTSDLTALVELKQLRYVRRQLQRFNPGKGGTRSRYGGTMSLGLRRGTLVSHPKYGKCLVGGNDGVDRVSLHSPISRVRLSKSVKLTDLTKIAHTPWTLTDPTTFHKAHKRGLRLQKKDSYAQLTRILNSSPA